MHSGAIESLYPDPLDKKYSRVSNEDLFLKYYAPIRNNLSQGVPTTSANSVNNKHVDSSTSLILKKTTEIKILQQYSAANFTSNYCNRDQSTHQDNEILADKTKPLIKVTIIPKSGNRPGAKRLGNQRIVSKSIHNTSSNHENSIHTKNVYLVVAGRKKDKIYEIKTTGSAEFDREQIKDDAEHLNDFTRFVQTLNMEGNKKKGKKKNEKNIKMKKTIHDNTVNKFCTCSKEDEVMPEVKAGKSRVRIFGRIGLTDGDKYVLKCHATVDDKPVQAVSTRFSADEKNVSTNYYLENDNGTTSPKRAVFACAEMDTDIKSQRDSIMQTDYRSTAVDDLLTNIDYRNRNRKESQSTQVNFNNKPNMNKPPFPNIDQVSKCCCGNKDHPKKMDYEYECHNLNASQSPLVIISVYPKHENQTEIVKTVQCTQLETQPSPESNRSKTTSGLKNITKLKSNTKTWKSRSPSPKSQKTTAKINKPMETRQAKANLRNERLSRSQSPKKGQTKVLKKGESLTKQTIQFFNSNSKKETITKKIKVRPDKSPIPVSTYKKEPQRNIHIPRQSFREKPKEKQDKGINTEHLKTKKALVESYTKKLSEQMNGSNENRLRNSFSKVSVNIDSKNEQYDVTLKQDRHTTDLNVRRKAKESSAQKFFEEGTNRETVENVLSDMTRNHRKSNSQSIKGNLSNEDVALVKHTRRLTTRDSLEISHRREEGKIKTTQTRGLSGQLTATSDMDFMAPVKHFTGDSCIISDPIERDREIRTLLGVEGRKSNFKNPLKHDPETALQLSRLSFHPDQCDRPFQLCPQNHKKKCPSNKKVYCNGDVCDQTDIVVNSEFELNNEFEINNIDLLTDENYLYDYDTPTELNNLNKQESGESDNNVNKEFTTEHPFIKYPEPIERQTKQKKCYQDLVNSSTQYEDRGDKITSYQQTDIHRNVQVFLQDRYNKPKKIVLSRQQYKIIKRTLQNTIKDSKKCTYNSLVTVGQIRKKYKQNVLVSSHREVQTDRNISRKLLKKNKDIKKLKYTHANKEHVNTNYTKMDKHNRKPKNAKDEKNRSKGRSNNENEIDTVVLFSKDACGSVKEKTKKTLARQTVSTVVRYASVAYLRQVTFSSTNVGTIGSSSYAKRNRHSIETLFRGNRKPPTPNFGTSDFSLLSDKESEFKLTDAKDKKPFLRRLMSCLVMRRVLQKEEESAHRLTSENSSVDSYCIGSSLAAIEMTSSMYDTSVSFYSNHSIHPLSNKLKRGFFSSVRGFLTSRKS